jgi:hypothetical protein
LYAYYKTNVDKLYAFDQCLHHNFADGILPAATFNFGLWTISFPHTDPGNLLNGWCSITRLGPFDSKRDSHIILQDLGLVIEFSTGSTVFIPSTFITHSNVPIACDECHYSFIQYCSEGIFRYIANGFRTDDEFLAQATKAEKAQREMEREGH